MLSTQTSTWLRVVTIGAMVATSHITNCDALSISTDGPPVSSLSDGRSGAIAFRSITPKGTRAYVSRQAAERAEITGVLTLPENASGSVPAVIILHGSSGVSPGDLVWAKRIGKLGIASFVLDSFTGRGVSETQTDQSRLPLAASIADAFSALRLLATHPAIDAKRIAIMGFSRGGSVALYSTLEPFRRAIIDDDLRFAAHIPFYPSCGIAYVSNYIDKSPILMLLGGKDDYTPSAPCVAYADDLRANGATITAKVYPDAYHGFDRDGPLRRNQRATSARNCHGAVDLDSGNVTMHNAGGGAVSGSDAASEAKECLTYGVTLGGDPEGRETAPGVVETFLKAVFGPH